MKIHLLSLPALLSFQQLPVCCNLNVQSEFDVHELLVFAHLAGHVLLGSLEGLLELLNAEFTLGNCLFTTLLSLSDLGLQVGTLKQQ